MRIVTRGDLDGLACAVLLAFSEGIEDILLVHPQELTEGEVEILDGDIIANLPYHPACSKWFDHHLHVSNAAAPIGYEGRFGQAPSAARLVYEYYDGERTMPHFAEMVRQTDRLDSADLTLDDVLAPESWIKLGFTIDGRSGLGAFESYFMKLFRLILDGEAIDALLAHPEVERRWRRLEDEDVELHTALQEHSRVEKNVVLTDFRDLDRVPVGNRFLVFALFPAINVAARVQWGPGKAFAMLTLGHSIFNRTCQTNVGELAARYGGGGHRGAGSLKLLDDVERQVEMVLAELTANG
ncbi:MAG: exopolyphosphatase [Acidobacteriota bacterium]